ncbi:hypothetical protein KKB44_04060 [Candidatus Micrarchaeota archaeon]|nr:hypothetical protein [Candidatus Micrarchaeota archaeon]
MVLRQLVLFFALVSISAAYQYHDYVKEGNYHGPALVNDSLLDDCRFLEVPEVICNTTESGNLTKEQGRQLILDTLNPSISGLEYRFFEQLDTKVKSSLMFRVIEFEPYSKDELKSLLQVVAKRTLLEDSCDSEVLGKVAELGASNEGNARFAIWLLFSAAKDAEERNSEKIELDDVVKAYERLVPIRAQNQNETGLCEEELLILDLLKEGEKESSEIYEIVQKRINRSKRQIRNYLSSLAQKGHIKGQEFEGTNSMLKPKVYRVCQRRLNEVYD